MFKSIDQNYIIRKAKVEDYLSLHRVYFETWLDTYPNEEFNITVEDIEYKFKEKLNPEKILEGQERIATAGDKRRMLLIESFGEVIGLCNCSEENDHNKLQAIYVLPKYHGMGLGYALWREAKKVFNLQKDIIVYVASYNKKAINFYEKLGFKSTGKIFFNENHKMRNGAMIPELKMVIKK